MKQSSLQEKIKEGKETLVLHAGPASSSSVQGTGRVTNKISAIVLALEVWERDETPLVGYRTAGLSL